MPSAVRLREDYSAEELRALAAVEERQPEPAASVAGCGSGWNEPGRPRGSAAWTARRCATGFIASTRRVRRASRQLDGKAQGLAFRRSSWPVCADRRGWPGS